LHRYSKGKNSSGNNRMGRMMLEEWLAKEVARAEEVLDECMDALARADAGMVPGIEEEDEEDEEDDEEDDEDDFFGNESMTALKDLEDLKRRGNAFAREREDAFDEDGEDAEDDEEMFPDGDEDEDDEDDDHTPAPHFCAPPPAAAPGLPPALMVDVPAGHALYLPAGWFHDVTSFNAPKVGLYKLESSRPMRRLMSLKASGFNP
jgi:hypothetical protein